MNVPEPERHVAGVAITPGMALTLAGGTLTVCAATSKPTHISMGSGAAGDNVSVYAVNSDMIHEVDAPASFTAKEGDKVQLGTDGASITNTTTNGVATVVSIEGDKVQVKF